MDTISFTNPEQGYTDIIFLSSSSLSSGGNNRLPTVQNIEADKNKPITFVSIDKGVIHVNVNAKYGTIIIVLPKELVEKTLLIFKRVDKVGSNNVYIKAQKGLISGKNKIELGIPSSDIPPERQYMTTTNISKIDNRNWEILMK